MSWIIIVYLLLQLGALLFLSLELKQEMGWVVNQVLISLATCVLYLATHCRDPGYFTAERVIAEPPNSTEPMPPALSSSSINSVAESELPIDSSPQPEKRYCKFCKIDQLMRMKHCYQCQRCVATFDHHCIWLDCCIGEKNRPIFFVYIVVQLIQITDTMIAMIVTMYERGEKETYQIVVLSFLGIIGSAVLSLVLLHGYLMAINMTTWEKTRWERVHYLVEFEPSDGSPFHRGLRQNIKDYWTSGCQREFKSWKFTIKPRKPEVER